MGTKDLYEYFEKMVNYRQRSMKSLSHRMFTLTPQHRRECYFGMKFFDKLFTQKKLDYILNRKEDVIPQILRIFGKIEKSLTSLINRKYKNGKIEEHKICSFILCRNRKSKRCRLYKCSSCKETQYCSKKCQKIDWKIGHYKNCF